VYIGRNIGVGSTIWGNLVKMIGGMDAQHCLAKYVALA
jgi:hypothetical protein